MRRRIPSPISTQLRALVLLVAFGLLLGAAAPAGAHNLELTDTLMVLKSDGTYQIDMTCDLDALALGVPSTADSAALAAEIEERAGVRLRSLPAEEPSGGE